MWRRRGSGSVWGGPRHGLAPPETSCAPRLLEVAGKKDGKGKISKWCWPEPNDDFNYVVILNQWKNMFSISNLNYYLFVFVCHETSKSHRCRHISTSDLSLLHKTCDLSLTSMCSLVSSHGLWARILLSSPSCCSFCGASSRPFSHFRSPPTWRKSFTCRLTRCEHWCLAAACMIRGRGKS